MEGARRFAAYLVVASLLARMCLFTDLGRWGRCNEKGVEGMRAVFTRDVGGDVEKLTR